jgi:predicted dehydrogenase
MKTKIGIIGTGSFATASHYPVWSVMDDVAIEAVCDLVPEKTEEKARQYNIPHQYNNAFEMIDKADLDAIAIILPPKPVFDIAICAFEKGLHTFIEKPPGMDSEQTRKLAAAAEKNGCHSQAGLNRRFSPVIREARERILKTGAPQSCAAIYNKFNPGPPAWDSGDWLLIDGLHALDCLFILADSLPKKVFPYTHRAADGFLSRYSAQIEFENGCVGTYMGNYNSGVRRERFEVHGDGVSAYIAAPDRAEIYVQNKGFAAPIADEVLTDQSLTGTVDRNITYGYLQEYRHFIDVIQKKRKPEVTLREMIPVMELVDTIRKA